MARDALTGSRIRERRIAAGIKQAELARRADISASYLNLIEHNRRRIGGKLLLDIAEILGVEASILTEGAEAALIASLREVAHDSPIVAAELNRLDEFAGRFPGWAGLLAAGGKRIDALERTVATLTDRLTHDPHLAASLHDMLTTVTAIRSAASILADPGDIEPDWQDRFVRNINEDSARLADISQGLVQYLDSADDASSEMNAPQEELDGVLAENGFAFEPLESGQSTPEDLAGTWGAALSRAAREMLRQICQRTSEDIAAVPKAQVLAHLGPDMRDPFALAAIWQVDPPRAMRRIAALAPQAGLGPVALAICDASGAMIYRQPLDDFPLPRFGAGCPVLPLYQAMSHPMLPVAGLIEPAIRVSAVFRAHAYAQPTGPLFANRAPLLQAHMLVQPEPPQADTAQPALEVGVTCRICPREACPGRSEPSILTGGL